MMNTKHFSTVSAVALIGAILLSLAGTAFAAGTPLVTTGTASNSGASATLSGTVNPNNVTTTAWFEYGQNGSMNLQTAVQSFSNGNYDATIAIAVNNVVSGANYSYRLVAENAYGRTYGAVRTFNGSGSNNQCGGSLSATTYANPFVNGTTATVTGSITSSDAFTTHTYFFQYGTTFALGQSTQQQMVTGYNQTNATLTLNNLTSNATYYYRLVAQHPCGTQVFGQTFSFLTGNGGNGGNNIPPGTSTQQPTVTTQAVTTRTNNSATMAGIVNANGSPTTAWFEYGTNASNLAQLSVRSVGSSYDQIPRSTLILSLTPGTTYFYRLAAQNSYGTSYGQVLSFTTNGSTPVPAPTPVPTPTPTPTPTTPTPTPSTGSAVLVATPDFSKDTVSAGDEVVYTLKVKNSGSAAASNVSVTLTLPKELEYSESDPNLSSNSGSNYVFALGALNVDEEKELEVTLKAKSDLTSEIVVQVNSLIDYTDATNHRQTLNGSRTVKLSEKGESALANIGDAFGRVGNIPGYIWFFIFLLALISVVTWIFFKKLRGTEPAHDSHEDHVFSNDTHGVAHGDQH